MDRYEQHLSVVVIDVLRAIAVVIVDIQNCHPISRPPRPLGRDGGIVQVAIAAAVIASRMMARRPAQRESVPGFFVHDCRQGRKRGLGAPIGRRPCIPSYRSGGVETVTPKPGINPLERQFPPSDHGPGVSNCIALPSRRAPLVMRRAKEFDIATVMDLKDRLQPEVTYLSRLTQLRENDLGAGALLGVSRPAAVVQFLQRLVGELARIEIERDQ